MTHEMDIWHDSFVKIKEQTKTIEMRLFDEKRSLISTGDTIIFTDTSNKEKIDCMVINMYRYLSFEELYQHHSKVSIGYNKDEIANPKEMLMYYSKEMIEKYGASGYYIPSNCVQGYDASPFANATPITWTQKDIRPGDVIFVWDNAADGTKTNFEHCYLVQRVENDVAYVTDGGVIDASGAVKARYDKTYSSLSSEGTWISKHLIGCTP